MLIKKAFIFSLMLSSFLILQISNIAHAAISGGRPVDAHHCGNGILETELGELCDNGGSNGTPGNECSDTCTIVSP